MIQNGSHKFVNKQEFNGDNHMYKTQIQPKEKLTEQIKVKQVSSDVVNIITEGKLIEVASAKAINALVEANKQNEKKILILERQLKQLMEVSKVLIKENKDLHKELDTKITNPSSFND
jgi:hypothetical protein